METPTKALLECQCRGGNLTGEDGGVVDGIEGGMEILVLPYVVVVRRDEGGL